jgi:ABC-type sugar transport system permease subunit
MVTELYIYLQGFRYNQMNLAAAASMLILVVTILIIFIQFRLREGHEVWE